MSRPNGATSLPEIIMGESEYDRLLELAAAAGRRAPETAAPLLQELERATVVEMRQIPPDVVRLGSKVTYKRDGAEPQEVSLVLPAAADIRSEEHTSELQSIMRISYSVFCLKKKTQQQIRRYKHVGEYRIIS